MKKIRDLVQQFAMNERTQHHPVDGDMALGYSEEEVAHGRLGAGGAPLKDKLRQLFGEDDIILPDEDFDAA